MADAGAVRAQREASAESSSVRVSIDKIDGLINLVGELVITQSMLDTFREGDIDAARMAVLEHGLALGGAITLAGFITALVIVIRWITHGLGPLGDERLAIVAFELLIVGLQIFFSSFLLSILGLRRRDRRV